MFQPAAPDPKVDGEMSSVPPAATAAGTTTPDQLARVKDARRDLLVSVGAEVCVGLAIVAAAAFMASSPPAAHTLPVWPFSWQFSLVTVNEDPDLRREVIVSLAAIGVAVALTVASLVWRRFRLVALGVLVAAVVLPQKPQCVDKIAESSHASMLR